VAGVILLFLALRPGNDNAAVQGHADAGARQLVDSARRHAADPHARLLALSRAPADSHWLASWGAAPEAPSAENTFSQQGFVNQTLREIVIASSDGAAVRVHLSNAFGTRPLLVGRASVADAGPFGRLAGAAHGLSFDGADYVSIPAGATVVSDPVMLNVHTLQRLAVSLYLPESTGPLTYHGASEQTGFLGSGDDVHAAGADWTTNLVDSWYVLSGIDTFSPRRYVGAVAAIGDSITAGYHSTQNSFGAWPDDLARRMARLSGIRMAVIDEGISGNRLLNAAPCCGPSTLTRFSPDVLQQAGVRAVVLLEGTNDIGFSQGHSPLTVPHTDVTAAQIIAGDEQIIVAAHRAGLRIYGATLLPFKGAFYWTPAGEAKREAVNRWILTSRAFDGVINFAPVMAEPGHPQTLNPAYNSGDDLHPNNAGYLRMADTVKLSMLLGPAAATSRPARTGARESRHRAVHS
jgi:lysophospholipase L1-like esterase